MFTTLCMIHSRRDFCFNFCHNGVPHAFILIFSFYFLGIMVLSREVQNLIRREEEEEQEGEETSEKSKVVVVEAGAKEEKTHSLDFL